MTHTRTRRHRSFRRRLPGPLWWLVGGDDHRLAQVRYGTRESASERAERRESAARRRRRVRRARQVQRAARQGQQWEDAAYTTRTPEATTEPFVPAMPSASGRHEPLPTGLSALPPGFTPATPKENPPALTGAHPSGRPALYVVDGHAPRQASARSRLRRAPATGTRTGSR
ncbi:hypothetical protein [Streptomyces sp. NPDC091416]|uniref:hypothetical protein n=1 Tax=Streptomyces sp. NPDC091416 TaxID=3366003 RepID=UPI0038030C4B